tara:strand:- start:792 stop:971 length:180 start_codon:yes stop_codon:yes gene_type:complete
MAMVDFNAKSPNLQAAVALSFLRISVSKSVQLASVHSAQTGSDCHPMDNNTARTLGKES